MTQIDEPRGVYGRYADVTPYLRTFPQLTHAQCDALAELAADLRGTQKLDVLQTWTDSGGTHLYVGMPNGDEYHVAASGNVLSLDAR